MQPMDLTVEDYVTGMKGFALGRFGALTPDVTLDGYAIRRLTENHRGWVHFGVNGPYDQNAFTALSFSNGVSLASVDAKYATNGKFTVWLWYDSPPAIQSNQVYTVSFT